jgi:crotonobetainyl-CoA:carnitine CoA-transferase CaiB-like acyl-CoA transferase
VSDPDSPAARRHARGAPASSCGEAHERSSPLLRSVRVLDLTNVLSGPFCTYHFAQLGADVIKVEIPNTGDLARQLGADEGLNARLMGASFLAQNGGKRSLTANLKTEAGREILRRLVRTADVLVENFRPGVMDRLGVGHEALLAINPRIVYCAISGFGQSGPLKDAPAYDQIIQGLAGAMSITGDERCAPLRIGYPIADTLGGITAAFAIASALLRRERTGEGAFIDVSMLESMLASMGWVVSNFLLAGREPRPMGNENATAAPSGTFATGDGLLNIAANTQAQFEALARAVGRPELIDDPRFAGREARKRHRALLTAELEKALGAASASCWHEVLNRHGIPAAPVLGVPDALRLPQVVSRGLLRTIEGVPGLARSMTVTRAGFRVSGGDPDIHRPPPLLGEHTEELLCELGYDAADIAKLRAASVI